MMVFRSLSERCFAACRSDASQPVGTMLRSLLERCFAACRSDASWPVGAMLRGLSERCFRGLSAVRQTGQPSGRNRGNRPGSVRFVSSDYRFLIRTLENLSRKCTASAAEKLRCVACNATPHTHRRMCAYVH